jgi:hypothetical protein
MGNANTRNLDSVSAVGGALPAQIGPLQIEISQWLLGATLIHAICRIGVLNLKGASVKSAAGKKNLLAIG